MQSFARDEIAQQPVDRLLELYQGLVWYLRRVSVVYTEKYSPNKQVVLDEVLEKHFTTGNCEAWEYEMLQELREEMCSQFIQLYGLDYNKNISFLNNVRNYVQWNADCKLHQYPISIWSDFTKSYGFRHMMLDDTYAKVKDLAIVIE